MSRSVCESNSSQTDRATSTSSECESWRERSTRSPTPRKMTPRLFLVYCATCACAREKVPPPVAALNRFPLNNSAMVGKVGVVANPLAPPGVALTAVWNSSHVLVRTGMVLGSGGGGGGGEGVGLDIVV